MSTLALLRELRDVRDVLHDALEDGHQATDAVARLVSAKCLLSAQLTDVEEPPRRTLRRVVLRRWVRSWGRDWVRQQLVDLARTNWRPRPTFSTYNPESIRISFDGVELTGFATDTL